MAGTLDKSTFGIWEIGESQEAFEQRWSEGCPGVVWGENAQAMPCICSGGEDSLHWAARHGVPMTVLVSTRPWRVC